MPLCTLHLLALHSTTPNPLSTFLSTLKSSSAKPLVISRVIRWIILPTKLSTSALLAQNIAWDILLILPNTTALPPSVQSLVAHHWSITAGVPSRLVSGFASTNAKLLHPNPASVPPLSASQTSRSTTSSSQALELSAELDAWINNFVASAGSAGKGAVSMFNLLAFAPGQKASYLKYGAAFASSIGSRHGGVAKIVGNIVDAERSDDAQRSDAVKRQNGVRRQDAAPQAPGKATKQDERAWDEIALAHYPSIAHFRDMLLDREYQDVNHKYRVGSLSDTAILMTSELAIEELSGVGGVGAKL